MKTVRVRAILFSLTAVLICGFIIWAFFRNRDDEADCSGQAGKVDYARSLLGVDASTWKMGGSDYARNYFASMKTGPVQECEPYVVWFGRKETDPPEQIEISIHCLGTPQVVEYGSYLAVSESRENGKPVTEYEFKFERNNEQNERYKIPPKACLSFMSGRVIVPRSVIEAYATGSLDLEFSVLSGVSVTSRFNRSKFADKCLKLLEQMKAAKKGSLSFSLTDTDM